MKYIINIELEEPVKSCADCPICYDTLYCSAESYNHVIKNDYNKRPADCPLKEVNEE